MNILEFAEPVLICLALIFFLKSGMSKRFPAMMDLFGPAGWLRGGPGDHPQPSPLVSIENTVQYSVYFYTYWSVYTLSAITIFFVIQEIFCHVTEPVPGIRRFGLLAFRWVAIISVIISVSSAFPLKGVGAGLMAIGFQVMRCVSILQLCLLAFLALFIHRLGRSFRSMAFGIALGFGVQAAMELILSVVATRSSILDVNINLVLQVVDYRRFGRLDDLLPAARAGSGTRSHDSARLFVADPLERDRQRSRPQHAACCRGSVGSVLPSGCREGCGQGPDEEFHQPKLSSSNRKSKSPERIGAFCFLGGARATQAERTSFLARSHISLSVNVVWISSIGMPPSLIITTRKPMIGL